MQTHWLGIVHPQDQFRVTRIWQLALAGWPRRGMEYRCRNSDGDWVWIEDHIWPVAADLQGRTLVVGSRWHDITARKRCEAEFLLRLLEPMLRRLKPAPQRDHDNVIPFRHPATRSTPHFG